MNFYEQSDSEKKIDELYEAVSRRCGAAKSVCPVEMTEAFLHLCLAESCGKCVPCRIGLKKCIELFEKILSGAGLPEDLTELATLAETIYDSADCAIGFEAARLILSGLTVFRADYLSHIEKGVCTASFDGVPCQAGCPAHVDIPGYIALIKAGRFQDAVRLIRNDNPFPGVCGLICEHPCEKNCRRALTDAPVNIRALKRYAVEMAGNVPTPEKRPDNGHTVAIVGGGPAGLTAAYYLTLKGFRVTIFEKRPKLGGMLRYGIPAYRLPDADLDRDINVILSLGMDVRYNVTVGKDVSFEALKAEFEAVYLSIGAHGAKKLHAEGEDLKGVLSAVELLGAAAEGTAPDLTGKRVAVVGGGNVAMDATRTALRLGAKFVTTAYRRRIADMTALPEEIESAQAEGAEILELMSPVRIVGEDGCVTGLTLKPQLPGAVRDGRPAPKDADLPEETLPCDIVIIAIGQAIESKYFGENGLAVNREKLVAEKTGQVKGEAEQAKGVFTGGDCYTGPATVIRAIDAGKVASENIEAYFGLSSDVREKIELPAADPFVKGPHGRVNLPERSASERVNDMDLTERGLTCEEAMQECSRCLRCDRMGYGAFRKKGE